jgi:hypothetical protein
VLSAASSSIALHLDVFWLRGGERYFMRVRLSGLFGLFELLELLDFLESLVLLGLSKQPELLDAFETGESILLNLNFFFLQFFLFFFYFNSRRSNSEIFYLFF